MNIGTVISFSLEDYHNAGLKPSETQAVEHKD